MVKFLFLVSLLASALAQQTCPSGGNGPCQGGGCETTNEICLPDGNCCNKSELPSTGSCVDKVNPTNGVSDCPRMASYCTNSAYLTLMKDQCPRTCGYCTSPGACVDKVNPTNGISDCPRMASYCTNSAYLELMRDQCPKTCRYC